MPASGSRNVKADPGRAHNATLSFSGCGFLSIYYVGVCAAIKEYIPQLLQNGICGASAGSIIAAGVICNICISKAMSLFLSVVSEARSYTFSTFNRDFDLVKLVRVKLNAILPSDAHELCTGRLRISVTRFRDMENVILDEFYTRDELIDAICCSCFIPVYGGLVYPTFRGEIYIDGGASDNQPVINTNTITVSPFSGESDICPTDEESASLFEWNFAGTSIRLTANNLYRAALCLLPPSVEECMSVCRSGFNDALKFLINNGFIVNVSLNSVEDDLSSKFSQINNVIDAALLPNLELHQESYENGKIGGYIDVISTMEPTHLPFSMQSAFDETRKKNWFLDYISSFWIVQLARYVSLPLTAAYQWFKFCQCLSLWLTARIARHIADDWQSMRIKEILNFILNEVRAQESEFSARLSQQLAVTELESSEVSQQPIVTKQLNINLSSEAIKEREALKIIDKLLSKTTLSSVKDNPQTMFSMEEKSPF